MPLPPRHDPMRLYAHALEAGDERLAELIARRVGIGHTRAALLARIVGTLSARLKSGR